MDGTNKRVLLAEDNLVNQKLVALLLKQLGLEVDVVENGKQAIKAAQETVYAVILMDCQMPEMDGFEATRAIRKLELLRGSYSPIIAVTALAMVGDRARCISAGMDDYISKPIDRQMLKIKLNHWMQKDFVQNNQELSRKYALSMEEFAMQKELPINLAELEEFYEDDLADVLKTFVETTERLIVEIQTCITRREDQNLAHMAHELKGSSAAVGAKELAKLGLYLERAAGLKDWSDARETCNALENAFFSLKRFLADRSKDDSSHGEAILPGRD
ncbi:MAG TPA: response regulator [Chroococcales cyanobacterium]